MADDVTEPPYPDSTERYRAVFELRNPLGESKTLIVTGHGDGPDRDVWLALSSVMHTTVVLSAPHDTEALMCAIGLAGGER